MVALQIRDVPVEVRDVLVAEAAQRGQSLQVFLMGVLEHEAKMASNRALIEKVSRSALSSAPVDVDVVELIHRQREERTKQILDAVNRPSPER